jgi:RHS repeat-associated protein
MTLLLTGLGVLLAVLQIIETIQNCTQSIGGPTEHHFTGKERDSESGNDYFGARYYASTMGRFLSPDWSATEEGSDPVPYAKLDNPQTLNRWDGLLVVLKVTQMLVSEFSILGRDPLAIVRVGARLHLVDEVPYG